MPAHENSFISLRTVCIILLLATSYFTKAQEFTTLILVRHAEKEQDGTDDPSLSQRGKFRAERLAFHLSSEPIEVIFTTPFSRNTNTIYPTARLKGIITKIYEPHDKKFIPKVLEDYAGKTILICGHSNTIPAMLNQLTGQDTYSQLDEDDYDDIFMVTLTKIGNAEVTIFNY